MNLKEKLKEKLLEIPINYRAHRELYRLSDNLNAEKEDIHQLLNELCEKNILTEKIEYYCPYCNSTTILDEELLKELIVEDDSFECDECYDLINQKQNRTGFIYYDIKDKESLKNW